MPVPVRITIAIDEDMLEILNKMKEKFKISQSELIRRALKFYNDYYEIIQQVSPDQLITYLEMLPNGEHVILDIDHWLIMLKLVENIDEFWKVHEEIAIAHAETLPRQLKSPLELLKRLEACNFFSLSIESGNNFTLILGSDLPKKFLRIFIEKVVESMGYEVEIKEGISKLRIKLIKK